MHLHGVYTFTNGIPRKLNAWCVQKSFPGDITGATGGGFPGGSGIHY